MPTLTAVRSLSCAIVLFIWAGSGLSADDQKAISLFDGATLTGWTVEETKARVENGAIVVRKGSGWVRHTRVLANFTLTMEMRLIGSKSRAAVFVRAWPTLDSETSKPNNAYGVGLGAPAAASDAGSPWRRVEITCTGPSMRVMLDGALAYENPMVQNPQGYLALAVLEGTAEFRNIDVRPLQAANPKPGDGVFLPGGDVQLPRPLREVKPQYTAEAMRAKIEGKVLLFAVVLPTGEVGRVEVMESLDPYYGLDRAALEAAKSWRFAPGTKDGQPVAVLVTIELSFKLK